MDTNPLFTIALGLGSPWGVQRTDFDPGKRVLRLRVDFQAGSRFCCPECGKPDCPVHDTVEKEWRRLDFFQHQAFIRARAGMESAGSGRTASRWRQLPAKAMRGRCVSRGQAPHRDGAPALEQAPAPRMETADGG